MIAEDIELDYSIKGDAVVRTLIGGLLIFIFESIIVFALSSIMYFLNGGLFDVFIKFIALIFTIRIFTLVTDKQLTK